MNLYCQSCGFPLQQQEAIYYQGRCSCCVEDDLQRLTAWEQGQPDGKLDFFFDIDRKEVH